MRIRYNRYVKASSGDKDYAELKGTDFKEARDVLTKDGFSEHEYGDKDDNTGYAVYRKGSKEVELQYRWNKGKRKDEYHAGKVINVYVDDDINASCGKKSVKAGTTPWDTVKSLSVGQARVFTFRGDPCVFVGVPNGMIFRWYSDTHSAKSELNYVKHVIKQLPDEWEESLREYGFDQYDDTVEYQTLSAKNPVTSSTMNKHRSKITAGAGAGYTIKWTLESIRKVNSFDVVNVSCTEVVFAGLDLFIGIVFKDVERFHFIDLINSIHYFILEFIIIDAIFVVIRIKS